MSRATPPPLKRPPPRRPPPNTPAGPGRNALKEALAELGADDDRPAALREDGSDGEWLFKEGDVVKGPVPAAVLVDRIESGELDESTPVAREMGQWFPLSDVAYFNTVRTAFVERRRAEEELVAARTRRRRILMVRLTLMAIVALAPSAAGAVVGFGVVKARPWDDTQEWLKRPPPLVDLPPKPKEAPKVAAKKRAAPANSGDTVAAASPTDTSPDDVDRRKDAKDDDDRGGRGKKGRDRGDRKADRDKPSKGDKDRDKGKDDKDKGKRVARADTKDRDDNGSPKRDKDDDKGAKAEGEGGAKLRTLNQDQIMDGLKKGYGGFKTCIGTEIKRNPDVPGRITMAFSVANDGKAINFKLLERQVRTGPLADCMAKVVGKLRWPTFYGERKYVEFPLNISKKR